VQAACILVSLVVALGAGFESTDASAQAGGYPARPVRMIVPFSPGGSADNLARTMQPRLNAVLGQAVVLDNRPGASSIIGTELAKQAAPDGYTLLLVTTTHTVTPSLVRKLPFDPVKDFAGVSLVVSQPNILVVHPSVAAKSVKELVALGQSGKANLTFASGGNGSSPHLSGELLKLVTGVDATHVPYKGSGPGVAALLGGQVTMMFAGPLALEAHIKSGKVRALAVADRKRTALLPELPTMAEAGFPGIETGTWYAVLAPAGTPAAIIGRIHAAIVAVLGEQDMKARLLAQGVDIVGSAPRELDAMMREEVRKWAKLVKQAGIAAN
jgi:tripartite-type tricarboxylate transporter receptor subunit TctC